MANDITIVVEASVGDALAKLGLVKKAVSDVGDANAEGAAKVDANAAATDRNVASQGRLSRMLGFVTSNWKILVPAVAGAGVAILGFTGNLAPLVGLVPVLTVALAGLLAPFTTLAAIMVGFIPPLTLIVGLLGGLGAAFGLSFIAAGNAKKGFGQLQDAMGRLRSEFGQTMRDLAHAFMPVFLKLIGALSQALLYVDQLSKMNLGDALRSLSTTGVEKLTHFLDGIGHVIGKPIRLAFDIAFGPQGAQIRNSMLKIWTQIQDFFTKPPSTGGPSIAAEIGNWFGAQDFTAVGMRWATELAGAVLGALGAAFKHAMSSKGGQIIGGSALGGAAIGAVIGGPIGAAAGAAIGTSIGVVLNHYWPKITAEGSHVWGVVKTAAVNAFHEITTALSHFLGKGTWNDLAVDARLAWSIIRTVAVGAFRAAVAAGREVWKVFDTLIIKTGAWKIGVWLVRTAIQVIAGVARPILVIINAIVKAVTHWSGVVGGALLSAFNSVLGVVGSIIGGIQTAIGAAQSLAGALSSANPNQAVQNAGGSTGGRYGINQSGIGGHPSHGGGSSNILVIHPGASLVTLHAVDLSTPEQQRRVTSQISRNLLDSWSQASGSR